MLHVVSSVPIKSLGGFTQQNQSLGRSKTSSLNMVQSPYYLWPEIKPTTIQEFGSK